MNQTKTQTREWGYKIPKIFLDIIEVRPLTQMPEESLKSTNILRCAPSCLKWCLDPAA